MRRTQQLWTVGVGVLGLIFLYVHLVIWQHQRKPSRCIQATSHHPLDLRNSINLTDGTFTFHLDLSVYNALFPHLQRYRCREVISEESWCQGAQGTPLLLLAVKSHPTSSQRRAVLRRTWAHRREVGGFQLQPIFLMATTSDDRHASLVHRESHEFRDVLMWDFAESHHNLSLKERCFLQWLHNNCQTAAYIFKGDDDLFVNIPVLTAYLVQTPNVSRFIHGNIQYHSAVMREGKYAVPHALYPLANYPNFASGGGFIIPGPFVPPLLEAAQKLPVFPLDDVYLGLLTLAAGLSHQHDRRFRVWGPVKDELQAYKESLTVHGISMERIEEVWQALWAPGGGEGLGNG